MHQKASDDMFKLSSGRAQLGVIIESCESCGDQATFPQTLLVIRDSKAFVMVRCPHCRAVAQLNLSDTITWRGCRP